ncbi:MAG: DUF4105 domain-containing protein [Flavisolibacter sp.]|nr:DUF4105 domain-containing protein [Flavisolibacter sp.]
MLRKTVFLFFLFGTGFFSFAQNDSCSLRISLLTCSPGEELYATFGHTALRVKENTTGADMVFNYGTFEFSPEFYMQFIRGKLLYYLSVEDFRGFLQSYQLQSRSVIEQVLQLNCAEKTKLFSALQINAREENRSYRYDFLFDNCSTRPKDMVVKNAASPVYFKNILPAGRPTFRDLIHTYLDRGGQYWSKFGIDILMGSPVDKKVTNEQAMFLPDYTLKGFDSAIVAHHPLALPPQPILIMPSPLNKGSLFRPSVVFSLLLVAVLILYFVKKRWAYTTLRVFDFLFFFILGLAGIVMLFMWFGTDHTVCRNNLNLWWALPTHLFAAFMVHRSKGWPMHYFRAVLGLTILLMVSWPFLPQHLNAALLPILLLIIFRCWHLSKKRLNAGKKTIIQK